MSLSVKDEFKNQLGMVQQHVDYTQRMLENFKRLHENMIRLYDSYNADLLMRASERQSLKERVDLLEEYKKSIQPVVNFKKELMKKAMKSKKQFKTVKPKEVISPPQDILDTPLADLELSVRARGCLKTCHEDGKDVISKHVSDNPYYEPYTGPLKTIRDLLKWSHGELLCAPNFGRKSLNEVIAVLKQLGVEWE